MSDLLTPLMARSARLPDWSPAQWETALAQATSARVLARLAVQAQAAGWYPAMPAPVRFHLDSVLRVVERQRREVLWEVEAIARALRPLRAPVVLLKGAAYLRAGLPPSHGRLFSDIDILVPRERLDAAEGALMGAGWISDEHDAYNQMYYRRWSHEVPPLRHVQRMSLIDLHHTIAPPTSRYRIDGAALLARARPIDPQRLLHVLAPEDMVLHSAVHLFQEGEFDNGLRDLLDLADLLQHFEQTEGGEAFWTTLLARARELGLQVPLHHALHHLQRLFGLAPPPVLAADVAALRPRGSPGRVLMARLLALALRPHHPSCDTRWSGWARWLLYVRSHWLRMPPHLVLAHLARKAWMRRFPGRTSGQTAAAV